MNNDKEIKEMITGKFHRTDEKNHSRFRSRGLTNLAIAELERKQEINRLVKQITENIVEKWKQEENK
jgi:hypothetical protein